MTYTHLYGDAIDRI